MTGDDSAFVAEEMGHLAGNEIADMAWLQPIGQPQQRTTPGFSLFHFDSRFCQPAFHFGVFVYNDDADTVTQDGTWPSVSWSTIMLLMTSMMPSLISSSISFSAPAVHSGVLPGVLTAIEVGDWRSIRSPGASPWRWNRQRCRSAMDRGLCGRLPFESIHGWTDRGATFFFFNDMYARLTWGPWPAGGRIGCCFECFDECRWWIPVSLAVSATAVAPIATSRIGAPTSGDLLLGRFPLHWNRYFFVCDSCSCYCKN